MPFGAASFGIPVNHGIAIILFGFAMVIGFSGHRASLCGVAAVSEIIKDRRGLMLASFGKAILWAALVSSFLGLIMPEGSAEQRAWGLSAVAIFGGVAFGIGAAINNACAISTLTRIADGNAGLLMTLVGLTAGISLHSLLLREGIVPSAVLDMPLISLSGPLFWAVFAGLAFFAIYEIFSLFRSRMAGETIKNLIFSHRYKLALAALLIGVSNAVLNHFGGTWSYTSALTDYLEADLAPIIDHGFSLFLFIGVVGGMFASSLQLRQFRFMVPDLKTMFKHFLGGIFMGFGTALIPGGNDTVLFEYLPGLSPHALPVFGGMLLGIYVVLKLKGQKKFSGAVKLEIGKLINLPK